MVCGVRGGSGAEKEHDEMSTIDAISKPVVLDLELWQIRLLEKLAEENGRTIDELVNQIIREWIEVRKCLS